MEVTTLTKWEGYSPLRLKREGERAKNGPENISWYHPIKPSSFPATRRLWAGYRARGVGGNPQALVFQMSCLDKMINFRIQHSSRRNRICLRPTRLRHASWLFMTLRRQHQPSPTQAILDPSIAPAHGGVGDAGPPAAAASAKVAERTVARVGAGGALGPGKGRGGSSRVARLGSALDDVDSRSHGSGAAGGGAVRACTGEKVCDVQRAVLYT